MAAALGLHAPTTLVIVLAHVGDVDDFRDDVATFAGVTPEVFPAWERLPREQDATDEVFGRRLRVVNRLAGALPPRLVVASIQALLQPVPRREVLLRMTRRSRRRYVVARRAGDLAAGARDERAEVVEVPGEFSLRGGILDVFPPDSAEPVRIEFFGDEIESIRPFDAGIPALARPLGQRDADDPAELRRAEPRRASARRPSFSPRGPGSPWSSRPTCARRAGTTSAGSTTRAGSTRSRARSSG